MAQTAGGTYYAASSELVSTWPATSLNLANQLETRFAAKANLASPTFTGSVNAPTPTAGDSSTLVATTAFVQASGGLVLVASQSFSAVSSVSFNNVFTSTYANYRIVWNFQGSTPLTGRLRWRSGGSDATGNEYVNQSLSASASTVGASRNTETSGFIGTISTEPGGSSFDVFGPQASARTFYNGHHGYNGDNIEVITSRYNLTTSFDGVTIFASTGTLTGTIRIYGYRN